MVNNAWPIIVLRCLVSGGPVVGDVVVADREPMPTSEELPSRWQRNPIPTLCQVTTDGAPQMISDSHSMSQLRFGIRTPRPLNKAGHQHHTPSELHMNPIWILAIGSPLHCGSTAPSHSFGSLCRKLEWLSIAARCHKLCYGKISCMAF